mmetsp:Transcript_6558/g.12394  ORF Transcript_6558/g.12394 Transcript_6558/m.12394 type:complete len:86 (-) Transcript_6558:89-346(-)
MSTHPSDKNLSVAAAVAVVDPHPASASALHTPGSPPAPSAPAPPSAPSAPPSAAEDGDDRDGGEDCALVLLHVPLKCCSADVGSA